MHAIALFVCVLSQSISLINPGHKFRNIVFMRPNTTVFEISCEGGSWVHEWVIDLGIRHIEILADEPQCNNHNEQFLGVQPTTLVDRIIQWL